MIFDLFYFIDKNSQSLAILYYFFRLAEVREENLRHSQLATARENLKHIFTGKDRIVIFSHYIVIAFRG